jgi:hypothetical protein
MAASSNREQEKGGKREDKIAILGGPKLLVQNAESSLASTELA